MQWRRACVCRVELHYWEDDLVVVVVEGLDKAFGCVFDWVLTLTWMQAFTMKDVYFKTDSSPPVCVCILNGRINYSELGDKFNLDPASIKLNAIRFPREAMWEKIEESFKEKGKPVGTEENPILVTGKAQVHEASIGMFPSCKFTEKRPVSFVGFVVTRSVSLLPLRCG